MGIAWQPSENILLFANASRTWRAPVIDEQYEVQSAASSASATSCYLEPERLTSFRLGGILRWQNLLRAEDSLQLRTALFHTRGKDEIFKSRGIFCREQLPNRPSSVCAQPIGNYRNLPGYTIRGGEIEGYYESDRWFAGLTYSFMRGKRQGSPRNPWHDQDTWLADIPPRKATATLGARFSAQGLTFGWKAEFIRRQDRSPTDGDPTLVFAGMNLGVIVLGTLTGALAFKEKISTVNQAGIALALAAIYSLFYLDWLLAKLGVAV